MKDGVLERAADGDWIKSEWCIGSSYIRIRRAAISSSLHDPHRFKLHLQPKSLSREQIVASIPPLPNGKTVIQVFADYYRYLFQCTRTYIMDTHPNGDTLLAALGPRIDFVLSHPNGWGGLQQSQMREAAVLAGLIPDTPADRSRISFVSEGEASLHFAITNGLPLTKTKVCFIYYFDLMVCHEQDITKDDEGLLIVDAGGGTIDISAYARQSQSYVEIAAPECGFHECLS